MTDDDKPFTQADIDRVLELFETKYPDLYARYINTVQNPPEDSIVDVFLGEYREPVSNLILHVIMKEGFGCSGTVGNIDRMSAVQDVLLRRLGLWYR